MLKSQNGWPVINDYGDPKLHTWVIPARSGHVRVTDRYGSAGFVLTHFAMWYADTIEPLLGRTTDDWGYAKRPVRGSSDISNHASGTAMDLNAMQHPLGVRGTLTKSELAQISRRLRIYSGTLRHGAFYSGRVDEMHVEINKPLEDVERVARRLMYTPRGRTILKANPGQKAVILS